MTDLEDLKPGQQVNGILPNQSVTVVDVKWHGGDAVELVYKREDGRTGTRLVFRDDTAQYQVQTAPRTWRFDADGARFRLAAEAFRIHLAHLFDPVLAVHTSLIEPLPHQITAVYEEMLQRQPLRFLLADDPGAGKTIIAGLLLKELIVRGDVKRCLVCVPGSLVEQWQDEMWFKFQIRFQALSREMMASSVTGNPFRETDLLLVRLDQLARNDAWLARLQRSDWDLVIVDEAHKMSASVWSGEIEKTKRYQLGEQLSAITRHLLLMTATPHNGKEEEFQLFLQLLDPDRFAGRFREGVHRVDIADIMRRMVKEELRRFNGKSLFPERRAYTVDYTLSEPEMALYEAVTDYVRQEFNRAEQLLDGGRKGTVGFALTVLQRRLASSPEAIYRSLKRRRERLEKRLNEMPTRATETYSDLANRWHELPTRFSDDDYLDELPADEAEELEEQILDSATAALSIAELQAEIETLRGLERMAFRLRQSGQDQKWNQLATLLQENQLITAPLDPNHSEQTPMDREHPARKHPTHRRKLIIFTEHRDTLQYLHRRISTLFGREDNIVIIDGSVPRQQRREIEDRFRNDPNVHLLLATDAAGEGINLQRAHLMINYDLPWNPNRLEQRFGRIHRIGQTEVCHLWNLVAGQTREGYVYRRLLSKLQTESVALDGKVFDVLGALFQGAPLRRLLVDAIRYGDQPEVRARLDQAVDNSLDRRRVRDLLDANSLVQDSMDLSQIERIRADMERYAARRLQPHYIKSFFLEAFALLGGSVAQREPGRYAISYVPAHIRNHAQQLGAALPVLREYERICFDKALIEMPGKPLAQFICPGHPLLDTVIDIVLDRHRPLLRTGTTLVDPTDTGDEPRCLFFLQQTIRDATGRAISREVHFVEITPSGESRLGGGAPYLDYAPYSNPSNRPDSYSDLVDRWHANDLPNRFTDFAVLESHCITYAVQHLIPRHLQRVRQRRETLIDKTLAAVQERLSKEIHYWDRRAADLQRAEADGKAHQRLNAQLAQKRADELAARLQRRKKELEEQRQIAADPPLIIGGALILPAGLLLYESDPSPLDHRPITEARAMQAVMQAEIALGHSPTDVSKENLGYDIESLDTQTGRLRFIEVKGRRAGAETITVTRNEILTAINTPDRYILAIVQIDGDVVSSPRYVRTPFSQEPEFHVTSVNVSLRNLLDQSKSPS